MTTIDRCCFARSLLAATLMFFVSGPAGAQESSAAKQDRLIARLRSDAPPAEKALACKQLAVYGRGEAVPALAPLLADERMASWARIALEAIPDPAADDALRAALGGLRGRLLIGAINSIGVRRDAKAVPALTEKLRDADVEVIAAAAAALGSIGGDHAIKALSPLLASGPEKARDAVAQACIRCAERMLAEGKSAEAAAIYEQVGRAAVSRPRVLEAMRGTVLAMYSRGDGRLAPLLASPDRAVFNLGLSLARELVGEPAGGQLRAALAAAPPDRRVYLIMALADRGDGAALPAAREAAASGPPDLRVAAIRVLERLGEASAIPVLLAAAAQGDEAVTRAARAALANWPAAEVDAKLAAMLAQTDAPARLAAIELIGVRGVTSAVPALLRLTGDSDEAVRHAGLRALGGLAGEADVPALIQVLLQHPELAAAESALSAVCIRASRPAGGSVVIHKAVYGDLPGGPSADVTAKVTEMVKQGSRAIEASNASFGDPAGGIVKKLRVEFTAGGVTQNRTVDENETLTLDVRQPPEAVVEPLCAALGRAPAGAKPPLLRVLRAAGGPRALAAVRAATADPDAGTRETARRALCEWPSADALPDLRRLGASAEDRTVRVLAIRGQLRLIRSLSAPAEDRVFALKETLAQIDRREEKIQALAVLGGIPNAAALNLAVSFLNDPDVAGDAGVAAVAIAGALVHTNPSAVMGALEPVAKSGHAQTAARAAALLTEARKAAPGP